VRGAALLLAAGLAAGCTKGSPPVLEGDEKLRAKLQAEKDRNDGKAMPRERPIDPSRHEALAASATEQADSAELALPPYPSASDGKALVKLERLSLVKSVSGPKASVATDENFLVLQLQLTGAGGTVVDLSAAELVQGETRIALARDAQVVSGQRELTKSLPPSGSASLSLYFEVPSAPAAPVNLVWKASNGKEASLPVH
jgi:hypothetical protein